MSVRSSKDYFGMIKSYEDKDTGAEYPNAYWVMRPFVADPVGESFGNKSITFSFIGFKDKEAFNDDKKPIQGAVKTVTFNSNQYDKLLQHYGIAFLIIALLARSLAKVPIGIEHPFFEDAVNDEYPQWVENPQLQGLLAAMGFSLGDIPIDIFNEEQEENNDGEETD